MTIGGEVAETDPNCIFCKIVRGEIPSAVLHRDDRATAFKDIQPAAPTHILIVPNRHLAQAADFT